MILACGHSAYALVACKDGSYVCSTCIQAREVAAEYAAAKQKNSKPVYKDRGVTVLASDTVYVPNVCTMMDKCECVITAQNCKACGHRSYKNCECKEGRLKRTYGVGYYTIVPSKKKSKRVWRVVDAVMYSREKRELVLHEATSRKECVAWIEYRCPAALKYVTQAGPIDDAPVVEIALA